MHDDLLRPGDGGENAGTEVGGVLVEREQRRLNVVVIVPKEDVPVRSARLNGVDEAD